MRMLGTVVQSWRCPLLQRPPDVSSSSISSSSTSSSSSSSSSSCILLPLTRRNGNGNGGQPRRAAAAAAAAAFISNSICHNTVGFDDFAGIFHNRVVIAAALSGGIGQLMKPFTSTIFYRNNFDFKTALQPGGFPSTHSSAVVATATSLGFERGFADPIFGLAVVYAALIMYDAQGVRREVGTHAKTLNRFLLKPQVNSSKVANNLSDDFARKSSTTLQTGSPIFLNEADDISRKEKIDSLLLDSNPELISTTIVSDGKEGPRSVALSTSPLKESVGHTEIEVIAGALLGFFVSLAVCII